MTTEIRPPLLAEVNLLVAEVERLRTALRMILDRGRPVPTEEPDGSPVGMRIYLERREWDYLENLARVAK
jgi:hypothetical protein